MCLQVRAPEPKDDAVKVIQAAASRMYVKVFVIDHARACSTFCSVTTCADMFSVIGCDPSLKLQYNS